MSKKMFKNVWIRLLTAFKIATVISRSSWKGKWETGSFWTWLGLTDADLFLKNLRASQPESGSVLLRHSKTSWMDSGVCVCVCVCVCAYLNTDTEGLINTAKFYKVLTSDSFVQQEKTELLQVLQIVTHTSETHPSNWKSSPSSLDHIFFRNFFFLSACCEPEDWW